MSLRMRIPDGIYAAPFRRAGVVTEMIRASALLFSLATVGAADAASTTIVVSDVWSRPASGTAVIYAVLRNAGGADQLVGAVAPIATNVTLHETSEAKMGSMASMGDMPGMDAMTSMKSLSSIPIAAHGTTLLKPGGYHLMLDLRRGIKAGERIALRLHFAHAGWMATSATVRATP